MTAHCSAACEHATGTRCDCWCGGVYHGSRPPERTGEQLTIDDLLGGQSMRHADFTVDEVTEERVVITDVGHMSNHPTVTNDAEHVVERLVAAGHVIPGRRLFYYDSDGALDELLVSWPDGRFAGFAPGPGRRP
jgi:hypothetical protein